MNDTKLSKLKQYISEFSKNGICIAFSGGVDSTLLLDIANEVVEKEKLIAVTFSTKLHPKGDIEIAKKLCQERNIKHIIIDINELENNELINNPVNRCYICKKHIFKKLIECANENNMAVCIEGTNYDDLSFYRPGIKAIKELSIKSPLMAFEFTKKEIREIAKQRGISVSDRPSAPCLATRIPYNTKMNFELFEKIEECENIIKSLGFRNVRIRVHNNIARIEIDKEDFVKFIENGDIICSEIKKKGFDYVTLDIEGFRSGSMDIGLSKG